jgi:hypothetical protein
MKAGAVTLLVLNLSAHSTSILPPPPLPPCHEGGWGIYQGRNVIEKGRKLMFQKREVKEYSKGQNYRGKKRVTGVKHIAYPCQVKISFLEAGRRHPLFFYVKEQH